MSWLNKKESKEELLPDLPEVDDGSLSLPEIKDNPRDYPQEDFSINNDSPYFESAPLHDVRDSDSTLIKETINSDRPQRSSFDIVPQKDGLVENNPRYQSNYVIPKKELSPPRHREIDYPREQERYVPNIREISSKKKPQDKSDEQIYVRLDKFQLTQEILEEMKDKIDEIERSLTTIKDIKQKEEKEIEDWEREMHIMKTKIDTVDSNLFNKLG